MRHEKVERSLFISLSLPKSKQVYSSNNLFPFFYGLLSEGVNKDKQCKSFKIDEKDYFKRLLMFAGEDTIGAITIKPENDDLLRMLQGKRKNFLPSM